MAPAPKLTLQKAKRKIESPVKKPELIPQNQVTNDFKKAANVTVILN